MQHNLIDILVLSGGNARRLQKSRKIITPENFPSLSSYWSQEGPKGLTMLKINNRSIPLLDIHLEQYLANPIFNNITLGLGFASSMIIEYYGQKSLSKSIDFTVEQNPAGTIAPLLKLYLSGKLSEQPLLLSNGDNILYLDISKIWERAQISIKKNRLPKDECVVNIMTLVKHTESYAYGAAHYNEDSGFIYEFYEKQSIEKNPFIIQNNTRFCYINSGFSLIMNPKVLIEKFVSPDIFQIVQDLETAQKDYKSYETLVKYETLYGLLAQKQRLLGVHQSGYWADSGSEEQIKAIEQYYHLKIK